VMAAAALVGAGTLSARGAVAGLADMIDVSVSDRLVWQVVLSDSLLAHVRVGDAVVNGVVLSDASRA